MNRDWVWVATSVAQAAHREQLAEHGGLDGVRDLALLETFLVLNGYDMPDTSDAEVAAAFIALAAGELSEDELADWFRQRVVAA